MDARFNPREFAIFQGRESVGASASAASSSAPELSLDLAQQQRGMPRYLSQQRPGFSGIGSMGMNMGYGLSNQSMLYPLTSNQQPMSLQFLSEGKGKGKVVELDDGQWEEQFAQLEIQGQQGEAEKVERADASNADRPSTLQDDYALGSETKAPREFESIWQGLEAENRSATGAQASYNNLESAWDGDLDSEFQEMRDWGRYGDPVIERYTFEQDNIFRQEKDAFEQGVRIMKDGGNLSLAALAFEAAVQQTPDYVEAWVYLGHAQAQNEKETAAIRAMEQALRLDPNNQAALMGLAISYTNEGYDSTAYRTLERWLAAKYPQVLDPKDLHPPADMGFTDRQELHRSVTDHFIRAAQLSPDGEHMDPDVQVGLGVLFYGAEEYGKAVDCFQSALRSSELGSSNQREQLHLLWNRLGATLANSGRSEEAIAAYEQALGLAPNFVRARYNLGVSCINMHCHQEAACHFLAALEMHKSIDRSGRALAHEILGDGSAGQVEEVLDRMSAQNRSSTLYDTLRRVFNQMGRTDLAEKTVTGVDPAIFRPEFDF